MLCSNHQSVSCSYFSRSTGDPVSENSDPTLNHKPNSENFGNTAKRLATYEDFTRIISIIIHKAIWILDLRNENDQRKFQSLIGSNLTSQDMEWDATNQAEASHLGACIGSKRQNLQSVDFERSLKSEYNRRRSWTENPEIGENYEFTFGDNIWQTTKFSCQMNQGPNFKHHQEFVASETSWSKELEAKFLWIAKDGQPPAINIFGMLLLSS
ncbi:Plant self-incompatibility S1 [Arabidopsis suecica]|uniref:Plant self-incompatibility S1 n=1 Tax=Arabidopsis suecica TaxID=45249 RepID=A0A8T2BJY4_ARASU|nr:Plant self-incompatibility S1 [Arabidopsis suecica]